MQSFVYNRDPSVYIIDIKNFKKQEKGKKNSYIETEGEYLFAQICCPNVNLPTIFCMEVNIAHNAKNLLSLKVHFP